MRLFAVASKSNDVGTGLHPKCTSFDLRPFYSSHLDRAERVPLVWPWLPPTQLWVRARPPYARRQQCAPALFPRFPVHRAVWRWRESTTIIIMVKC
eukprot:6206699-Pleurochrysis_carterae.AAC.3